MALEFGPGWDVSGAILQTCRDLLNWLEENGQVPPDRIVPSPDGSVFFLWGPETHELGDTTQSVLAEVETAGYVEFTIKRGGQEHIRTRLAVPYR